MKSWENNALSRGNLRCKGPEVGQGKTSVGGEAKVGPDHSRPGQPGFGLHLKLLEDFTPAVRYRQLIPAPKATS